MAISPSREERLLARYADYTRAVAYKAFRKFGHVYRVDPEDFRQEAALSLLLALRRVDWSRPTREIDGYLKGKVWTGMIDFIRSLDQSRANRWRGRGGKEHVEVVLGIDDDFFSADRADEPFPMVDMLAVVEGINRRSLRDRQVLLMAIQGYQNVEISETVGHGGQYRSRPVTPGRVSQIIALFRKDSNAVGL